MARALHCAEEPGETRWVSRRIVRRAAVDVDVVAAVKVAVLVREVPPLMCVEEVDERAEEGRDSRSSVVATRSRRCSGGGDDVNVD